MGIDVQLRKENEEILGQLGDSGALARAAGCGVLQDTRLLRYIVPRGDAVFNQAQADDLLSDIRHVAARKPGSPLACHLVGIEPLVEKLRSDPHIYLWFVGDQIIPESASQRRESVSPRTGCQPARRACPSRLGGSVTHSGLCQTQQLPQRYRNVECACCASRKNPTFQERTPCQGAHCRSFASRRSLPRRSTPLSRPGSICP